MLTKKLRQLKLAKAKTAQLEAEVSAEMTRALTKLPRQFGFKEVGELISALKAVAGTGARRGRRAVVKAAKRGRAKITEAMRAEVKKFAEAGKTGREIAAAVGISLPSVQNVKKALGLVKARKEKPARKKTVAKKTGKAKAAAPSAS